MIIPHDLTDLYLAPVLLAVEARIEQLSKLDPTELALEVALSSDAPDWTRRWREQALAAAVGHLIDLHGWELTADTRGLRLAHRRRSVMIALPMQIEAYLADAPDTPHLAA